MLIGVSRTNKDGDGINCPFLTVNLLGEPEY